jgi:hypothetical protein
MKKNSPKIETHAKETLAHVKSFAKSDTPSWLVLAGVGLGLYAVTRVVKFILKGEAHESDERARIGRTSEKVFNAEDFQAR